MLYIVLIYQFIVKQRHEKKISNGWADVITYKNIMKHLLK